MAQRHGGRAHRLAQEISMSPGPAHHLDEETIRARRGRVDSVDIFEVKENELDVLERGGTADLYLNYAIFLLSLAFSAVIALATSTFKSELVETLVKIVMVVGFIAGPFLIVLWFRDRETVRQVVSRVRARIRVDEPQLVAPPKLPDAPSEPDVQGQPELEGPIPPKA